MIGIMNSVLREATRTQENKTPNSEFARSLQRIDQASGLGMDDRVRLRHDLFWSVTR
jgi:hypothetical protein